MLRLSFRLAAVCREASVSPGVPSVHMDPLCPTICPQSHMELQVRKPQSTHTLLISPFPGPSFGYFSVIFGLTANLL